MPDVTRSARSCAPTPRRHRWATSRWASSAATVIRAAAPEHERDAPHEELAAEHERIAGGGDNAFEIGVVDEKIDPAHTRGAGPGPRPGAAATRTFRAASVTALRNFGSRFAVTLRWRRCGRPEAPITFATCAIASARCGSTEKHVPLCPPLSDNYVAAASGVDVSSMGQRLFSPPGYEHRLK